MNIREAILRAADHIERYPEEFNFNLMGVPEPHCGFPGCAIGWILSFEGSTRNWGQRNILRVLGISEDDFYCRIQGLDKDVLPHVPWTRSPVLCAALLRKYADQYHPLPPQAPDWEAIAQQPLVEEDTHARV